MSDALASIAASFGVGIGVGPDAEDSALTAAGLPPRARCRPAVFPFHIPPTPLLGTTVGSFAILSSTVGVGGGWFWDVTSLSASGFTAGAVTVTKAAPAVTPSGAPWAIEFIAAFTSAGIVAFPQKGNPLLDANDDLYFTVTSALTAPAGVLIGGTAIMVPVTRIDDYLS